MFNVFLKIFSHVHLFQTQSQENSQQLSNLQNFDSLITLQMFTGIYRVFAGKLECRDFKIIDFAGKL